MEDVLKLNAQLDNTKSMVNVLKTQLVVPSTVTSLNVLNAQLDILLPAVSVTELLWLVLEETSSTALPGPAIKLVTNVKNGELTVSVLHVSVPLKNQLTEFVSQWIQPVLQLNMSILKETVLKTIFFVILSKNTEVNVLNVFGDINWMLPKINASRLFVQPDMFQTIMENVLKSVIFALISMPEETAWVVFHHIPWPQLEFVFNWNHHHHAHQDNIWEMITSVMMSAISVKSMTELQECVHNVLEDIIWCTLENVSCKRTVNPDKFWSTTTVTMLAQLVETMTEPPENVWTASAKLMNFIMAFVFQSPLVDQDNGLTKTDHAMMLMPNVTLSTHQLEPVPHVFKDTTTLTVFAVLRDNSTLTETVS